MAKAPKKIVRTAAGLRDALFDEMDRLRAGQSNPQQAQAVAKLACQIINSVKAEIEYQGHVRSISSDLDAPLTQTLQLGTVE